MRLRVTHKGHTHGGTRYAVGETFDGTARLIAALPDRLEAVKEEPKKAAKKKDDDANASDSK